MPEREHLCRRTPRQHPPFHTKIVFRDAFLIDVVAQLVEWVPVCPEVELAMGIPRPTIRLEVDGDEHVRLIEPASGQDYTEQLRNDEVYLDALGTQRIPDPT